MRTAQYVTQSLTHLFILEQIEKSWTLGPLRDLIRAMRKHGLPNKKTTTKTKDKDGENFKYTEITPSKSDL